MKKVFQISCFLAFISSLLLSCSVSKQMSKRANRLLLKDSAINQGHIGISIFDASTAKYLYNYNADKYFIPASNTKLFSWYAGMKYLGDSLVSARYSNDDDRKVTIITPAGDPTVMLSEFSYQPLLSFMIKQDKIFLTQKYPVQAYGNGWAWTDYMFEYMAARSTFPLYGNRFTSTLTKAGEMIVRPKYFFDNSTEGKNKIYGHGNSTLSNGFEIHRSFGQNNFMFIGGSKKQDVTPFHPSLALAAELLEDSIKKEISVPTDAYSAGYIPIFSQPSDSLFKPMMHRSDNFFAEQTLLMASNEYLGYMSDRDMIDTMLKTTLKDLPQQPKWVDGSGLSRYNLFTPQDFVWLLTKIKQEFTWDRITNTLPTGGEGTLNSFYKTEKGFIYAKTGTLSNNCALSGYLITKKNRILIFSVLVNNYPTGATPVRRAVEKFIKELREKH